jgi:hypothetical protein
VLKKFTRIFLRRDQIINRRLEQKILSNNATFCIIATMPRSGTWMTKFFFYCYNNLYKSRSIVDDKIPDFNYYDKINMAVHHSHTVFPSFTHIYKSGHRNDWDHLDFYVNGYNYGYSFLEANKKYFSPQHNPDLRVVYIYRNPLDQAVSFFQHAQNHKDEKHRYIVQNGQKKYFQDVNDFIITVGITSYLKQFLSFYLVREQYSDQLLFVPYEELKRDLKATYKNILHFMGHEITPLNNNYIMDALKFIDMKNLKSLEVKLGHSIGDDQLLFGESHMRGGQIGKWKEHLNNSSLRFVQQKLEKFNLSLDFFIIE